MLDQTLALPFVSAIIDALGIARDRFVAVQDGAIIPRIIVPEALLVENSAAHRAFSRFATDLADRLAGPLQQHDRDDRPLFLSKHRLRSGVRTIDGEAEVAVALEDAGVAVASPETLGLADQIRLWRRHPIIASFEGSAGHNAIFVRNKKLLSLSSNPFAPGNQVLIDAIADHQCLYLDCGSALVPGEARPDFTSVLRLAEPHAFAGSVLRAIAFLRNNSETMRMRTMSDTLCPALFLDEPFGTNLSRGRPCDMSSVDPVWKCRGDDSAIEAAGAVSGMLSATYQMHSRAEQRPWCRSICNDAAW